MRRQSPAPGLPPQGIEATTGQIAQEIGQQPAAETELGWAIAKARCKAPLLQRGEGHHRWEKEGRMARQDEKEGRAMREEGRTRQEGRMIMRKDGKDERKGRRHGGWMITHGATEVF
eukprot:7562996-Pyramimonas_sp.AAC.1